MRLNQFIKENSLKAVDAIVLRKKFLGMVDHYVIYMGIQNNNHVFIANYRNGVKVVSNKEVNYYLQSLEPSRIERFEGTRQERVVAFKRATSRIGERAYNYFSNNCEHFKNWVHYGENFSEQVDIAGDISIGTGAALALTGLATKNSTAALWGAGFFLAGILLKESAEED